MVSSAIVIGAGMSGLVAARSLQKEGISVTVIDKGRGVGGRLATRRLILDDGREGKCDHGAQYLTAQEPIFSDLLAELLNHDILKEWQTTSGGISAVPRYYAPSGMTAVAKHLAQGLKVRLGERVVNIAMTSNGWMVKTDTGYSEGAQALILTAPVPQTLMLLETLPVEIQSTILPESIYNRLSSIEYTRSIVLMMATKDAPRFLGQPLAPNGGLRVDKEAVWWIADNKRKGISPDVSALTIHATPAFSLEYWEHREEEIIARLLHDIQDILGNQKILTHSLHRWRYSRVIKTYSERYCALQSTFPCILASDAFSPSEWLPTRAEDAALSGWSAAEYMLNYTP